MPAEQKSVEAPAQPTVVKIPTLQSPSPLAAWLDDLVEPRLSTLPGLSGSCSADGASTVVDLSRHSLTCSAVVEASAKAGLLLDCASATILRAKHPRKKCKTEDLPDTLSRLHAPAGTGFFLAPANGTNGVWQPNKEGLLGLAAGLLPIETAADGPWTLSRPNPKTWLGAMMRDGAVAFELSSATRVSFKELRDFINQTPKPATLAGLASELVSVDEAAPPPTQKLLTVSLSSESEDPLLVAACGYIDKWIKARQILAGMDVTEKKLELSCRFRWREEPLGESVLRLGYLPLPLVASDGITFPLRTSQEARSLTALQGLRTLR